MLLRLSKLHPRLSVLCLLISQHCQFISQLLLRLTMLRLGSLQQLTQSNLLCFQGFHTSYQHVLTLFGQADLKRSFLC